jgi:hypothetical protein
MRSAKILTIAVICIAAGLTGGAADAQTYFSDNFDNLKESERKWHPLFGQWEFKDSEYHQLLNAVNCMSVVSDEHWNDDWDNYTFEVRASKIGGAEGFLIMFRCMGQMQPRGVVLKDHPPRMQEDKANLEYWWNLGGWANARSQVESWGGKAGVFTNHTIETDKWYEIRIVNTPNSYTCILDGEEIGTVDDNTQNGRGRIGLATWSTTARFDDVIVYGPNGPSGEAVEPMEKLATSWARVKSRL